MGVVARPQLFGAATFCDDIREEVGGKLSYIGVYASGSMFVHADFPVTLPKFGISWSFAQHSSVFDPNVNFQITMPGDSIETPSVKGQMLEQALGAVAARLEPEMQESDPSDRFVSLEANMIFTQLKIKEAGRIQVHVVKGGDLFKLGSLKVLRGVDRKQPDTA